MIASTAKLLSIIFAAGLASTASALPSASLDRRQLIPSGNFVTCNFVLQPTAAINPTNNTILFFEFDRDINTALSGPQIPGGSGVVNTVDVTFTANLDANNTFNVQETLGAQRLTAAQSTEIIEGWVGTTIFGLFSNWIVNAADCTPANQ